MREILSTISVEDLKQAYRSVLHDVLPYVDVVRRLDRAYDILVKQIDYSIGCVNAEKGHYVVSGPNGAYSVDMSKRTCKCPDSTDHGQVCKHRLAVRLILKAQALRVQEMLAVKASTV